MARGRPKKKTTGAEIATPATPTPRGRTNNRAQVPFPHKLVLNQWMLSLFNVTRFEDLAEYLRDEKLEGQDENNVHWFHHELGVRFPELRELSTELLLEYDLNIVRHTQGLNERRITRGEEPIVWKYFQYLALLFTEIYLDRYFCDALGLRRSINTQIVAYNADKPDADQLTLVEETSDAWPLLNKLAYWMATGSGKTLLMHANILQYQHYLGKYKRHRELNRILLLTPNEGLSQQHLREFEAAGIEAALFDKDATTKERQRTLPLDGGHALELPRIEIIEVTRLVNEDDERARTIGERSVPVGRFLENNLVLVDEGHRGVSAGDEGAWMRARNALCEKGFSFEYSATFAQAVKGRQRLTDLYAKSILCDYSYRYFYGDGFGKDYQILNLDEGTQQNHLELYLVACLLSFFQQQRLFQEHGASFRTFQHRKAAVDLRGRQRHGDVGQEGRLGHRRDPPIPGALRCRPLRQHPAD
jgi:hypothetical protein